MNTGVLGARDLRLVPPAVVAWVVAGVAVGVRDAGPALVIVAAALWLAALAVLGVAVRGRGRWSATIAVALVAGAVAVTAVVAAADRREPDAVLAATEGVRSSTATVAITGRPADGRVEGTILAFGDAGGLSLSLIHI